MAQLAIILAFIWFGMSWLVNSVPPSQQAQCQCETLPENYTVVETNETVTCINNERDREITRTIRSAKVER
jgi:hypothetical protein